MAFINTTIWCKPNCKYIKNDNVYRKLTAFVIQNRHGQISDFDSSELK